MKQVIKVEQVGDKDLVLLGRDSKGNRIREKITTFNPYFYVLDETGESTTIYGDKVKKITFESVQELISERVKHKDTFEADVHYTTRYLINNIQKIAKCPLRIMYFDIETDSSIDALNAPKPITCITCYDTFLDKPITFVWRKDLTEKEENNVYYFSEEKKMLLAFLNFVMSTDPDLFVGWNSTNFDIPYLYNRFKVLGLPFEDISPLGSVTRRATRINIKGRVDFDLLRAYRYITQGEKASYKLNEIAKFELKEEKLSLPEGITNLWRKDIKLLIDYNIQDTILLKKINDKKNIIEFFDDMRRTIGCDFSDVFWNSRAVDILVLRACFGKYVLPTHKSLRHEKVEGALVLDTKPGVHDNVAVFDLKSLYPSIMISFNMSPETISDTGEFVVGNGIKFKSGQGIIPKILIKLFKLRAKYKQLMLKEEFGTRAYDMFNAQQNSAKILLNSFYGVMGYPGFRLYKREIADSILYIGRDISKWSQDFLAKHNAEVIYGDTDSTFVKIKSWNVVKEGKKLCSILNKSYDDYTKLHNIKNHRFFIEFEKIYSRIFFSESKKRYVGWLRWKDGKKVNILDIVGFEIKRSDTSKIGKRVQKHIFEMILDNKSKKSIDKYIKNEQEKIKLGEYSIEELSIPKGMTRDISKYKIKSAYVRGAEYSNNNLGTNFAKASRLNFLYVLELPNLPPTDVVCFEYPNQIPKGTKINYSKMIQVIIDNKVQRIYDALGWEFMREKNNNAPTQKTTLLDF